MDALSPNSRISDPNLLDRDITTFLQDHGPGQGKVDQDECTRMIRGICERALESQAGAPVDDALIEKLLNNVQKLETWVIENGLASQEIRVMLNTSAQALTTLHPQSRAQQQYRSVLRELADKCLQLEAAIQSGPQHDHHKVAYSEAIAAASSLLQLADSAWAKGLPLPQRTRLIDETAQGLNDFIKCQSEYLAQVKTQIDADFQERIRQVASAKETLCANTGENVSSLMDDYRRFQQAKADFFDFVDACKTQRRSTGILGKSLQIPVSELTLMPLHHEMRVAVQQERKALQEIVDSRAIRNFKLNYGRDCSTHVFQRLKAHDAAEAGFRASVSDPQRSRQAVQLDLACLTHLRKEENSDSTLFGNDIAELEASAQALLRDHDTQASLLNDQRLDEESQKIRAATFDAEGVASLNLSPKQKEILLLAAVQANNVTAADVLLREGANFSGNGLAGEQRGRSIYWTVLGGRICRSNSYGI